MMIIPENVKQIRKIVLQFHELPNIVNISGASKTRWVPYYNCIARSMEFEVLGRKENS